MEHFLQTEGIDWGKAWGAEECWMCLRRGEDPIWMECRNVGNSVRGRVRKLTEFKLQRASNARLNTLKYKYYSLST